MFCMLLGLHIRKSRIYTGKGYRQWMQLFASMACVVLFLIIRILTERGISDNIEILLAPVYIGFAYFMFSFFMGYEERCETFLITMPGKLVELMSICSLEIYYV